MSKEFLHYNIEVSEQPINEEGVGSLVSQAGGNHRETVVKYLRDAADQIEADRKSTKSPSNTDGIKAGDPYPWPGIDAYPTICMARFTKGFWCTADQGHDGQHVATSFNTVLVVWTDK